MAAARIPRRCKTREAARINVVFPEPRNPPSGTIMDRTLAESMPNAPHFATTDSVEDAGTVRLAGESACPTGQTWGRRFRLPTPTFRTAGQQAHGNSVP